MDFYSMSDKAVLAELGSRLRSLRLRKNLTQQQLAERILLSLNTIKALEAGRAKLSSVVAVLRELNQLDTLDNFIPEPGISPLQLAKLKGKTRQRATGSRGKSADRSAQPGLAEDDPW